LAASSIELRVMGTNDSFFVDDDLIRFAPVLDLEISGKGWFEM
jgi:hypothetical protein